MTRSVEEGLIQRISRKYNAVLVCGQVISGRSPDATGPLRQVAQAMRRRDMSKRCIAWDASLPVIRGGCSERGSLCRSSHRCLSHGGGEPKDTIAVPGPDSQQAIDLLTEAQSDSAGLTAEVVVTPPEGSFSSPPRPRRAGRGPGERAALPNVIGTNDLLVRGKGRRRCRGWIGVARWADRPDPGPVSGGRRAERRRPGESKGPCCGRRCIHSRSRSAAICSSRSNQAKPNAAR